MVSNSRFPNSAKIKAGKSHAAKIGRHTERLRANAIVITQASSRELDALRLVHKLEVHRLELESQNNALREANIRADAACRELEDLYQHAPCGYHSLDSAGVFVRINDTELRWLGYSRDEIIGKLRLSELLPARQRPRFLQLVRRMRETGQAGAINLQLLRKDGSLLSVLVNSSIVCDDEGRLVGIRSTLTDMAAEVEVKHKLIANMRRIKELTRRFMALQDQERQMIAGDLHAQTSPNCAAMKMNLELIRADLRSVLAPEVSWRVEDTIALLDDTVRGIRETWAKMRPPLLDYAGLGPALEALTQQFATRTGIAVQYASSPVNLHLAPTVESGLFRIAQEALTNCAKYAGATTVKVELAQSAGRCSLTIDDNGIGFDPKRLGDAVRTPGLGLLNMRERAELIGAVFHLESEPGRGTRIEVAFDPAAASLPARAAAAGEPHNGLRFPQSGNRSSGARRKSLR